MAVPDLASKERSDPRAARLWIEIWIPLTAAILGVGLTIVANRGEVYLGFDAFHYVRNAGNIFIGNWDAITTTWPLGYPLLGVPLQTLGVHAARSLVVVLLLSFMLLFVILDAHLRSTVEHPALRLVLLTAFASLPIWHPMILTPNSEMPFTVLLVVLFTVLLNPNRKPWMIIVLIVSMFMIRYIGFVFLLLPSLALVRKDFPQRFTGKANLCITGTVTIAILFVAMCNWLMSGSPLGEPRLDLNLNVLDHLRDYGLAFSGLFGFASPRLLENTGMAWTGWIIVCVLAVFLWLVWEKRTPTLRYAAMIVSLYSLGLIATRSLVWFMPLDSPRFALPVLPLIVLMLVSVMRRNVRTLVVLSLLLISINCIQAVRHYRSVDPMTAIRMAENYLEPIVQSDDVVVTNDEGKNILRSIDADIRFEWAGVSFDSLLRDAAFVVLLAKYDYESGEYRIADRWINIHRDSTFLKRFTIRLRNEHFSVFEKKKR